MLPPPLPETAICANRTVRQQNGAQRLAGTSSV